MNVDDMANFIGGCVCVCVCTQANKTHIFIAIERTEQRRANCALINGKLLNLIKRII